MTNASPVLNLYLHNLSSPDPTVCITLLHSNLQIEIRAGQNVMVHLQENIEGGTNLLEDHCPLESATTVRIYLKHQVL